MTRVSRMPWPRFSHAIHAVPHNSPKLCSTFVNEGGRLKLACVEFIRRNLSDLRTPTSWYRNKLGCEYLFAELGYHGNVLLLANLGNRSCEFWTYVFAHVTHCSTIEHWDSFIIPLPLHYVQVWGCFGLIVQIFPMFCGPQGPLQKTYQKHGNLIFLSFEITQNQTRSVRPNRIWVLRPNKFQ